MNWIIFLAAGFCSGIIAGMGMGGGTILIPALTLLAGVGQHEAQGINMLAFVPGAIVALIIHQKSGRLEIRKSIPMIVSGVFGAVGGALIALLLDADWLKKLYAAFLILLAVIQFISGEKEYKKTRPKR